MQVKGGNRARWQVLCTVLRNLHFVPTCFLKHSFAARPSTVGSSTSCTVDQNSACKAERGRRGVSVGCTTHVAAPGMPQRCHNDATTSTAAAPGQSPPHPAVHRNVRPRQQRCEGGRHDSGSHGAGGGHQHRQRHIAVGHIGGHVAGLAAWGGSGGRESGQTQGCRKGLSTEHHCVTSTQAGMRAR